MAKAASGDSSNAGKAISPDSVSVLLMTLGNTSISGTQYDMMSALDGTRTANSFQHEFRAILQKAKELKARVNNGEKFEAVKPSKKRGAAAVSDKLTPPTTPKKPKATPKPRAKKTKATVENDYPLTPPNDDLGSSGADDFDLGLDQIVKQEKNWEDEFC